MVKERDMTYRIRTAAVSFASVLIMMMVMIMLASPVFTYATDDTAQEEPVREVHNVGVGNEAYCFFVTHNVVLTPADVAEMTDEELTSAILSSAGLYMKKTNCKEAAHPVIAMEDWIKSDGGFFLSEPDIEGIRLAEPVDGEPVKFYMDLIITQNVKDEEEPLYSTFKRTGPRLIFAVVATEEDAKYGEDICIEEKQPEPEKAPEPEQTKPKKKKKTVTPKIEEPELPDEDILPEYRTITMVDRSGEPIEETLKEGDPVTLEWIEPKHNGNGEGSSIIDRIPGGVAGIIVISAAAAAAIAAAVIAARKKKADE